MKLSPWMLKLIRVRLKKEDAKRHRCWPALDSYKTRLDVDALNDGVFGHQLDIYYASEAVRKNKVILDIHGGAYIYSDRKNNFGFCSVFVDQGYDVVALDYLPNDGKHGCRDQVETLAAQLRFLMQSGKELGLNMDEVYLMGDSAGGHYALLMAELSESELAREKMGLDVGGIAFKGVVLCCPVYDFVASANTPLLTTRARRFMFGPDLDSNHLAALSPRTYIREHRLPTLVTSNCNDLLKEESLLLTKEAKELGLPVQFDFIESENKEVDHVHNVVKIDLKESKELNRRILTFFAMLA